MKKTALFFCGFGIVIIWAWIGTFISDLSKEVNIAEALEASGALFTALAFAAAGYAVWLQRSSIDMQRQELELQRQELKDTREELRGQKEQLQQQNIAISRQSFESSLFKMIDFLDSHVKSFKYNDSVGRACASKLVLEFRAACNSAKAKGFGNTICEIQDTYTQCIVKKFDVHPYSNIVNMILEKIDTEKQISDIEKFQYCRLFRSLLTSGEIVLLTYHVALIESCAGLREYFGKYEFVSHLRRDNFDELVIKRFPQKAFRITSDIITHPTAPQSTPT